MTSEKNTSPATLATAKHGGCVQLGDGLPTLPDTDWNARSDGSEPLYSAEQMRDYAHAALSAQPSPGGQGDALLESLVARWRNHAEEIGVSYNLLCQKIANCTMRHAAELQATLAARQPVGEPMAWLVHWSDMPLESPEVTRSASRIAEVNALTNPPRIVPLYAAPPAQAVALGQLWVSVNDRLPSEEDYGESGDVVVRYRYNTPNSVQGEWDVGESRHDSDDTEWNNGWLFGSCDYAEVSHWIPKSALLALIDSKAVGNG